MKSYTGPPMTLGNGAAAHVRLIVWRKTCGHQIEPEAAEMTKGYGPETAVIDRSKRLVWSLCGSHDSDMVVSGTARR